MSDVTRILERVAVGETSAAADLLPLVYDELRKLAGARMAGERQDHTLDATALVHEAYLRLVGDQQFDSRGHFFAAAAEAMRRILVENARSRRRLRHGGNLHRQELLPDHSLAIEPNVDLIALDEALQKLGLSYPLHARLVELRYFAGLTGEEASDVLGISASTADRNWVFARAWMRREMGGERISKDS
jgi:RNA polymerase sigma factor (TIGR02999 family)